MLAKVGTLTTYHTYKFAAKGFFQIHQSIMIRRRVRVVTSSAETPLAIARERIRSVHIHTWELGQPDPE